MPQNEIQHMRFDSKADPDILEMADKLANLQRRKRHDAIRLLLLEALPVKIAEIQAKIKVEIT